MTLEPALLAVALTVCGASFLRAAAGFGDALFAVPLLAAWLGLPTATPLVALVGLLMGLSGLVGGWREVNFRAIRVLMLGAALGIPVGTIGLRFVPESAAKLALGVLVVAYSLYRLLAPPSRAASRPAGEGLAFPFGFASGVLGGAFNTGGPPVVAYAAMRDWSPAVFRASLQSYFLFTSALIVANHALSGHLTARVMGLFWWCVPAVLLGTLAGSWVGSRIPRAWFSKVVYGLLVAVGALLILTAR